MIDIIKQMPDWLGAAICGVIGWFSHIGYESWRKWKKPFQQDVDRFNSIISAIDPYAIEYFKNADVASFSELYSLKFLEAFEKIDLIRKFGKSCLDRELNKKEHDLVKSLNEIISFIAWKSYFQTGSKTSRTCLWDNFSYENDEHLKTKRELQKNLNQLGQNLSDAYQSYKTYGDKKFAIRDSG